MAENMTKETTVETPVERPAKESTEKKKVHEPLSGPAKYAVATLGVLIMLGGMGFVFAKMTGGSSSGNQQMVMAENQFSHDKLQDQNQADQTSQKLRALMAMAEESEADTATEKKVPETTQAMPAKSRISVPAQRQASGDWKNEAVRSTDQMQTSRPAIPVELDSTDVQISSDQINQIIEKLAVIEESIGDKIKDMTLAISDLKDGVASNGDRVDELAGKVNQAPGSGVDIDKYARFLNEKQTLVEEVASLEKEVKILEGKYEWVRHLETKKSQELQAAQRKLEEAEKELAMLSRRPVFGEWQLAGLSSEEALLVNPYSGDVKRLHVGDSFRGVRVEKINASSGTVHTNAGTIKLG